MTHLLSSLFVCFLVLSVFCFTSSADVCIYHFIDRFKQYEMPYEDVVLGGPRTSQYSPSVGERHFLIYLFEFFLKNQQEGMKAYHPMSNL